MYNVKYNNYRKNEKDAMVYTPESVSKFLFNILPTESIEGYVLDPCVGKGSLLRPFETAGFTVVGIDIVDQGFSPTLEQNYLAVQKGELMTPGLVIMNPPFNIDATTKSYIKAHYGGRPLLPELWLRKTVQLFGKEVPIVLFTPYGFRLNLTVNSKRWQRLVYGTYPDISSIVSLPKNVFDNILFHSEVLIFNMPGMKGHYFYGEKINKQEGDSSNEN